MKDSDSGDSESGPKGDDKGLGSPIVLRDVVNRCFATYQTISALVPVSASYATFLSLLPHFLLLSFQGQEYRLWKL